MNKKEIKRKFITFFIHPTSKEIEVELGKTDLTEPFYIFDDKKKDFIEIGYPIILRVMKLPLSMSIKEVRKWLNNNKHIGEEIAKLKEGLN